MKREWTLFIVICVSTVVITLLLVRWLAPYLLGIPVDLQMVQVEKKVPPFFDGVFREEDRQSNLFTLPDPVSGIRSHPLIDEREQGMDGPHDILGFRNRNIPSIADIVFIGDSQTYGVNVPLDFNWPSTVKKNLKNSQLSTYNMAVGGWGGVQYYYIFKHALNLRPRVVVVAFYTGNDSLESFTLAYGSNIWKEFRLDPKLKKSDVSTIDLKQQEAVAWPVTFKDGVKTVFTPQLRLAANLDHPAIKTGYEILGRVAEKISTVAQRKNIKVVFTIIPTKELVYAKKVKQGKIKSPRSYVELVTNELMNIDYLKNKITSLPNAVYVDVLTPLQNKSLFPSKVYPSGANGHPIYDGYYIIGKTVAQKLNSLLPTHLEGIVQKRDLSGGESTLYYVHEEKYWVFSSYRVAQRSGWDLKEEIPFITYQDVANLEYMGLITNADPKQYGPAQ